jgi:thiol-disulfide isomerase/thioredoxin
MRQATWADLSAAWEPSARHPDPADEEPRASGRPVAGRTRVEPPSSSDWTVESCTYDTQRRQILDFRLADLEGRAVSLNDFDSDFILVDFWGTWCRPCLASVPHLVELQKRFDTRSLSIVGVACENGPASASAAHVADVARQLGINYTVLVSSKDNSASPMQEALHVAAYPTMILVDRKGRVVWRDQGSTTTTLSRLERVLAVSTRAAQSETVRR